MSGKALITGGCGFIGRHFHRHLVSQGWDVTVIDTVRGYDARDLFRGLTHSPSGWDLVLHCAAVVGGRAVIEGNPLAQSVNLDLDASLFRWARAGRPGRVIYFSSSAAYPVLLQDGSPRIELAEDEIKLTGGLLGEPDGLYGWMKLTGEQLARRAAEDGVAVSVVRPFSGYGEDQDACYPFPAFVDRALKREDPFIIWGDGQQVRDFVHVDDIVGAVMTMYQNDISGPVNLGSGRPVSMRALAAMVCEQAGYRPAFETVPSAPSGVAYRVASTFVMSRFYRPKVTLEEGIRRALAYRAGRLARHGG